MSMDVHIGVLVDRGHVHEMYASVQLKHMVHKILSSEL